jgi:predicted SnoaL-like aldol condensation-catalyzing enzyme
MLRASVSLLMASLLLATSAVAGQPTDLDGRKTASGKIVYEFIELMWNSRKPEEAFDKYVSQTNYHNRYAGGPDITAKAMSNGFAEEKVNEARVVRGLPEGRKFEIQKLFAQGDQVFVEVHATGGRPGPGGIVWMLFRVKGGKIIEHADLHGTLADQAMADYVFR